MKCICLDDYRKFAEKKLQKSAFYYIDGGSDEEITKKRNEQIYRNYTMIPRILRSSGDVDLSKSILGFKCSLPFGFGPWAMGKLSHEKGQSIPAKIAEKHNICYILSILTNTHPKQIQEVNKTGLKYLQLYLSKNWDSNKKAIKMAQKYGFHGIVITVDGQVLATRRKQILFPLNQKLYSYPLLEELSENKDSPRQRVSFLQNRDLSLDWEKIKQIRSMTNLKVILKGILHPEDAVLAKQFADAVYISNHGGRQLDTVQTPIEVLPEIRAAVGKDFPLFIDGGIKTGGDIFKCLALGADYVFVVRSIAYGLVDGEQGVENVVQILKDQFRRTMILNGAKKIEEISPAFIGIRSKL